MDQFGLFGVYQYKSSTQKVAKILLLLYRVGFHLLLSILTLHPWPAEYSAGHVAPIKGSRGGSNMQGCLVICRGVRWYRRTSLVLLDTVTWKHPCLKTQARNRFCLGSAVRWLGASWKRKFAWGEGNFAWGLLGVGLSLLSFVDMCDICNMCVRPIRTLYLLILTNQLAQFIITSFPIFQYFGLSVCLGIWYFFAWGWIFRAVCLGMWFSGSCLLRDVDFCTSFPWGFTWGGFDWVCETEVYTEMTFPRRLPEMLFLCHFCWHYVEWSMQYFAQSIYKIFNKHLPQQNIETNKGLPLRIIYNLFVTRIFLFVI